MQTPPGDIAADLRRMIEGARDVFTSPVVRTALPGLIADMSANAELTDRIGARFTDLFAAVRARLQDAVVRGEVRDGVDPDRLVDLVGGATLLALLQTPDELASDSWVDKITDILLHGVIA